MAKKPNIPEKYLRGLTTEQLQRLIKFEGKQANNRIDRLKRAGVWKYNAVVQGKWETLLADGAFTPSATQAENVIKNRGVLATAKGHFSTQVKGLSRNALIQQYKQIRQFLSQETTVKGTREQIKRAKEKTGVKDASEISKFFDMLQRITTLLGVDSNNIIDVAKEMHEDGLTYDEIITRAVDAVEQGGNYYDNFVRDENGDIEYL